MKLYLRTYTIRFVDKYIPGSDILPANNEAEAIGQTQLMYKKIYPDATVVVDVVEIKPEVIGLWNKLYNKESQYE